jgi:hypothetical protein
MTDSTKYRIALPALHQLAIREFDGRRRLGPRHATLQREIVEWRPHALAHCRLAHLA